MKITVVVKISQGGEKRECRLCQSQKRQPHKITLCLPQGAADVCWIVWIFAERVTLKFLATASLSFLCYVTTRSSQTWTFSHLLRGRQVGVDCARFFFFFQVRILLKISSRKDDYLTLGHPAKQVWKSCLMTQIQILASNNVWKSKITSGLWTEGFPCGSAAKESTCNVGDLGLIPVLGRPPGEGKGYPLQYSGLENSMDYIVHGVAKTRTQLSDFHFHLWTEILNRVSLIILSVFRSLECIH